MNNYSCYWIGGDVRCIPPVLEPRLIPSVVDLDIVSMLGDILRPEGRAPVLQ
jgi:hypothetical protein